MRYVVFPSFEYKNEGVPSLEELMVDPDIIVAGPTRSGVYIVEGSETAIQLLKFMADSYYIFMQDFESPTIQ